MFGKSESTMSEILSLNSLPDKIKKSASGTTICASPVEKNRHCEGQEEGAGYVRRVPETVEQD